MPTGQLPVSRTLSTFSTPLVAQDGPPHQVLFTNVHVWDGVSEGVTQRINMLVEGNIIRRLRARESDVHAEATVIEADGKFLMPGLIDSHVHLTHMQNLDRATKRLLQLASACAFSGGVAVAGESALSEAAYDTVPRTLSVSSFVATDDLKRVEHAVGDTVTAPIATAGNVVSGIGKWFAKEEDRKYLP